MPHILARNWAGLGFGYGYAFAQDNICAMASDYVTVEAQRSRCFGPRATYIQRGDGTITSNLDSDLFFPQIIDSHRARRLGHGAGLRVLVHPGGHLGQVPVPGGRHHPHLLRVVQPGVAHYADQTALFSRKQWLPDRFRAAQISSDPHLTVTTSAASPATTQLSKPSHIT